ncbi:MULTISPECIES: glycosyltransferase [unclassified Treponema]|uniref:glycosyltransferase n=1 Tax=unclassified Treponema TaxID=2638727 RepID=UPI0020A23BF9|nr:MULTISPECIES: glycosyltransferase [unclassified Treponema]UTC68199.1 glycosyltransferase [Treponema sp. OMZ 789]UTC70919.1 glycosyltransferase [Treponema sp. OMZ 790]UTC73659.1 glycosyltransferase [Treponema sp. OMZ 791]
MQDKEKLKLLFITYTHSNGGGAEKVLTTLLNNLDSQKYDISIFEIVNYNVKKEPLNSNVEFLGHLYSIYTPLYIRQIWDYVLELHPEIIKTIKNLDADIVISWNYQKPSFMLPAFKDKKVIAWFHGAIDDLDYTHTSASDKYYRDLQRNAWDCADKIITISNKSLKSLEKVFPEYLHKSRIIHNPIDIEDIRQKAESSFEFNIEKYGYPFLTCIGRLDKNKNVSLVIQSLSKLNRVGIQCGLLVIGIGEEEVNLKAEAEKLEIYDKVFFLGYQQNPMPYLKQSKILCMSSFAEGFPTVVCEAMALGKPFVTTPVAGASEELAYGEKCGLLASWDVDDYTDKLKKLLTDTVLYTQMSENCLERIKDFSVENTVLKFENLLASLPEKQTAEEVLLTKQEAFKKIKAVYVWYPDEILKRIKFSITRFKTRKTFYHFMLFGYHILNLSRYTLCTPFRMCTAKKVLLRKETV